MQAERRAARCLTRLHLRTKTKTKQKGKKKKNPTRFLSLLKKKKKGNPQTQNCAQSVIAVGPRLGWWLALPGTFSSSPLSSPPSSPLPSLSCCLHLGPIPHFLPCSSLFSAHHPQLISAHQSPIHSSMPSSNVPSPQASSEPPTSDSPVIGFAVAGTVYIFPSKPVRPSPLCSYLQEFLVGILRRVFQE